MPCSNLPSILIIKGSSRLQTLGPGYSVERILRLLCHHAAVLDYYIMRELKNLFDRLFLENIVIFRALFVELDKVVALKCIAMDGSKEHMDGIQREIQLLRKVSLTVVRFYVGKNKFGFVYLFSISYFISVLEDMEDSYLGQAVHAAYIFTMFLIMCTRMPLVIADSCLYFSSLCNCILTVLIY